MITKTEFPKNLSLQLDPVFETPKTESVKIATVESGKIVIHEVKPEEVSKNIGAKFRWSNSIMAEQRTIEQKKSESTRFPQITKVDLDKYLSSISENQKKLALIKHNETVGFGVIALQWIFASQPVGIYTGLYSDDNDIINIDVVEIPLSSNFNSIDSSHVRSTELLIFRGDDVYYINRVREELIQLELTMEEITFLKEKLQPKSIPKTHNRRTLPRFVDKYLDEDNHSLNTSPHGKISGTNFRGYIPMMAHAMSIRNPDLWPENEPCLLEFSPVGKKIKKGVWQNGIVKANLLPKHFTYNGFVVSVFFTSDLIPANSILAFNYGIGYWSNHLKIPPALIHKDGSIVDPSTYTYRGGNPKLIELFNNQSNSSGNDIKVSLSSPEIFESSVKDNDAMDIEKTQSRKQDDSSSIQGTGFFAKKPIHNKRKADELEEQSLFEKKK